MFISSKIESLFDKALLNTFFFTGKVKILKLKIDLCGKNIGLLEKVSTDLIFLLINRFLIFKLNKITHYSVKSVTELEA